MGLEKVINIRGTLLAMEVGASNSITLQGVRGDTLRKTASALREVFGAVYHINKTESGFKVWREA